MAEQLSESEYKRLCEALGDGFPDMLGKRNPGNISNHGNIFATNPMGEEVTYFLPNEGAPSTFGSEARKQLSEFEGGLYDQPDELMGYFALNPFGFNLERLGHFFELKVSESRAMLEEKFRKYLETAERIPYEFLKDEPGFPDVFDGVYSYPQWLELILVPYSKTWFEHQIVDLIKQSSFAENDGFQSRSSGGSIEKFRLEKRLKAHFLLGRMVEHYKWKFKYESALVSRKSQFESAGHGGGKASQAKRLERLEALMIQIELLSDLSGKVSEDRILAQAWDNVQEHRKDMPATPKTRFGYEVELRSAEPFKARYDRVFRKNA